MTVFAIRVVDNRTTMTVTDARDMSIVARYQDQDRHRHWHWHRQQRQGQTLQEWAWGLPVWPLATVTLVITTFLPMVIGQVTGAAPADLAVGRGNLDDGRKPIQISTYLMTMITTDILERQATINFFLPRLLIIATTDEGHQTQLVPRTTCHHM